MSLTSSRILPQAVFAAQPAVPNHSITGTLIFQDDHLPDTSMKIRFFAKGLFGIRYHLGNTTTQQNGSFKFDYHWSPLFGKTHEVVMEVVEKRRPFANRGLHISQEVVVETFSRSLALNQADYPIGNYLLRYDAIPQDLTRIEKPAASHMQSIHYYLKLIKAVLPEFLKKIFVTIFQRWLSPTQVQSIYDLFGSHYVNKAPTAKHLIEELLNQISSVDYQVARRAGGGDQIVWIANWDQLNFDMDRSLPDVRVVANRAADGSTLELDHIDIHFREDGDKIRTIGPQDPLLDWAIFVTRSVFALKGEAETHLAEGHLLPGIAAKAFFKYIKPENPIFASVAPHASQLDFINWVGAQGIIFGKGSVLEISSLSDQAVSELIINHMKKKADYRDAKPPVPINNEHHHARVGRLHYQLLLDFFTKLVTENRVAIEQRKEEIYRWSECMHSKLAEIPKIMQNADQYTNGDETRLIECLTWLVYKTTFLHWSAHSRQQLLTDIRAATLAMREFGLGKDNRLAPGGNTEIAKVNNQLFTARVLLNFDGDTLLRNPYGDISRELIERIRAKSKDYLPYRVEEMHLTTQI